MRNLIDPRHVYVLVLALFLAACANNPLKVAENDEERAYALIGIATIAAEAAADVVQNSSVDRSVRQTVQRAMQDARPVIDALDDAVVTYLTVRGEFESGQTTEQRLLAVAANLNRWIDEAGPVIRNLASLSN